MNWPPDESELRAIVLRICAEGALIAENRLRPERSRYPRARLRVVLDALVDEGAISRHEAGALTVYIAWPEG
jgi:hypothetical protein